MAGREADGAKAERAIVVDEESCQSGNETSSLCSEAMGGAGRLHANRRACVSEEELGRPRGS